MADASVRAMWSAHRDQAPFVAEQLGSADSALRLDAPAVIHEFRLLPSLADVASDPQFTPEEITPDQFELAWDSAHIP